MLQFVCELLSEVVPRLDAMSPYKMLCYRRDMILASGKAALDFDRLLQSDALQVTREKQQLMLTKYVHHVSLYSRAGGTLYPKHHMMFHMILKSGRLGNPSLHATFRDESFNGVVAAIAKSSHRHTFCQTVHMKLNVLTKLGGSQQMH